MSVPKPSDHLTALIRDHSTVASLAGRQPTCTGCNTTQASHEDHTRHIAEMILEHYELKNGAVPTKANAAPATINTHPIK